MHHSGCRVSPLDLPLCRGKHRVHTRIVHKQGAALWIRDQLGCALLDILLRTFAVSPDCHFTLTRSAARLAAEKLAA